MAFWPRCFFTFKWGIMRFYFRQAFKGSCAFSFVSYRKGFRLEREIVELFAQHGFCVIRAAGSGNLFSPDILVFKKGLAYGLEVKGHEKGVLSVPKKQVDLLKKWEETAGITTFVAWRRKKTTWRFIPLFLMEEKGKTCSISWEKAFAHALRLEDLVR